MAGSKGAPRPRSTRYRRFSLAVLGCPSRKFSGLTSPCTYLRAPRAAGHDARPSRPRPPPHPAAHRQEAGRRARRAGAAHPLRCSFSRMDSASTAMQDTISCDITCPCEFHTSQRLGPSMSITCARARARARPPRPPGRPRGGGPPPPPPPRGGPPVGPPRPRARARARARSGALAAVGRVPQAQRVHRLRPLTRTAARGQAKDAPSRHLVGQPPACPQLRLCGFAQAYCRTAGTLGPRASPLLR